MKTRKSLLLLLLKHFDAPLGEEEKTRLLQELATGKELRQEQQLYARLRSQLARKKPASFQPYFSERVLQRIRQATDIARIDINVYLNQLFAKFIWHAGSVLILLIAINWLITGHFAVAEWMGITDESMDNLISYSIFNSFSGQ